MTAPRVSVFIPTWNGGPEFRDNLAVILGQKLDRPFEVVVIDSGSKDGTLEFLQSQPVRVEQIPNRDFNHGLTRNRGIELCRGDIVVLTVQDARPESADWLQRMVDCFDDAAVVGAFGRQVARADANPFIKHRLSNWVAAGTEPRRQEIESAEAFWRLQPLDRLHCIAFDNVNSAVRRSMMTAFPFRERKFGEDIDWSLRVILAGHRIVFEPRSAVVHSHNNSAYYEFKRTYADHANLHETLGVHTIPTREALRRCIVHQARVYRGVVDADERLRGAWTKTKWRLRAWAYSIAENSGQYFGAKSKRKLAEGSRFYRWLDRRLRRGV
ncbi:MAG TPA: glycosyltransferase [Planctomycetota bacterium]|nr:glycosyltransferase [Planctomycetota bacterium]